jgi:hypothetical protein
MTPRLLALALVLAVPVLAGCNPAQKVIGKWDLEIEEPKEPAGGGGLGGTYIPPAIVSFMQLKRIIEFQEDGDCVVEVHAGGQTAKAKGKWRHVKTKGNEMVLKVKLGEADEKEVSVRFIDNNKIETVPLPAGEESWPDETVTFTRRPF